MNGYGFHSKGYADLAILTETKSGDEVNSSNLCFANLSACRDFIKSSLRSKASLALQETGRT